jgi:hypothetical protein
VQPALLQLPLLQLLLLRVLLLRVLLRFRPEATGQSPGGRTRTEVSEWRS